MQHVSCETEKPSVYIVDDDAAVLDALTELFESVGLAVHAYARAGDFLQQAMLQPPACLLLDIRIPDMDGLMVQKQLRAKGIDIPVIILTGYGKVSTAIAAMKNGAVDFIEKPFDDQVLLDCVQEVLRGQQGKQTVQHQRELLRQRFAKLTPREQEIFKYIATGMTNKAIAETLQVSFKTVEAHRSKVMQKMQSESLADLIRMALALDLVDSEDTEDQQI